MKYKNAMYVKSKLVPYIPSPYAIVFFLAKQPDA